MGTITEPPDYADGVPPTADDLNLEKFRVYNEINGRLDSANLKAAPAFPSTICTDQVLVAGNTVSAGVQTITRPTTISGVKFLETDQAGWGPDPATANVSITTMGSTVLALVNGKGLYAPVAGAGTAVTTITGGASGDVIWLYLGTNASLKLTHTATDTADTVHLKDATSRVSTTIGKFVKLKYYTAAEAAVIRVGLAATGWWEI